MRRVLCCTLFLAACQANYEVTEDVQYVTLADPFERVVVDVENGEVLVLARTDDVAEAGISVTSSWSRVPPTWDAVVDRGVLRLTSRCRPQRSCTSNVEVRVPPAVTVEADARAGRVIVGRIVGDVDARSDAGDIVLDQNQGDLTGETDAGNIILNESSGRADLWSGAGNVEVIAHTGERLDLASDAGVVSTSDVTVPIVIARSDSGAIELHLDGALDRVVAETDGGPVSLDVPAGGYRLELDAEAGSISLDGVEHVAGADGLIHAETDAGSIEVIGH